MYHGIEGNKDVFKVEYDSAQSSRGAAGLHSAEAAQGRASYTVQSLRYSHTTRLPGIGDAKTQTCRRLWVQEYR